SSPPSPLPGGRRIRRSASRHGASAIAPTGYGRRPSRWFIGSLARSPASPSGRPVPPWANDAPAIQRYCRSPMADPPGNYQYEIYLQGMSGTRPELPVALDALERRAAEALTPEAYDYVAGGAGAERTVRANREAF